MAKYHSYREDPAMYGPDDYEVRQIAMLKRALDSISDLLDELQRGNSIISMQQEFEMEEIIKDARVQGLLT